MLVAGGKGDGALLRVTEVGFDISFSRSLFLKERREKEERELSQLSNVFQTLH